jgi:hypothetical protein
MTKHLQASVTALELKTGKDMPNTIQSPQQASEVDKRLFDEALTNYRNGRMLLVSLNGKYKGRKS